MGYKTRTAKTPYRTRAPKALASLVAGLTRPLFSRRGLADGAMVRAWSSIAGPMLAAHTIPERVVYERGRRAEGTLHLRVDSGGLAVELQHLEPQLIERVNGYFGYRAVAHLKMTQGPLPRRAPPPPAQPPLDAEAERALADTLAAVEDPALRAALEGLGRGIMGRTRGRTEGKTG